MGARNSIPILFYYSFLSRGKRNFTALRNLHSPALSAEIRAPFSVLDHSFCIAVKKQKQTYSLQFHSKRDDEI